MNAQSTKRFIAALAAELAAELAASTNMHALSPSVQHARTFGDAANWLVAGMQSGVFICRAPATKA